MRKLAVITTTLMVPSASFAHPGHAGEVGLTHALTDPFHLGVAIVATLVVGTLLLARRRNRSS